VTQIFAKFSASVVVLIHSVSRLLKSQRKRTLKGYSTFFGEIGSFYNFPRVKLLSLTVFESIQLIF